MGKGVPDMVSGKRSKWIELIRRLIQMGHIVREENYGLLFQGKEKGWPCWHQLLSLCLAL